MGKGYSIELQRRLDASGSHVLAAAAHPGMAVTNLGSSSKKNPLLNAVAKIAVRLFAQDATSGAAPTLFAATEPMPGAGYAGPGGRREMTGPPVLVSRSDEATDAATAARLWTASEELTGIGYPL